MDRPATESFEAYVQVRLTRLLRIAYLLSGDVHQAEDLVQATLLRVWPRWTRVIGQGDPDAYVRRCLVNVFLSWRRRANLEIPADISGDSVGWSARELTDLASRSARELTDADTRLVVVQALARLPRRQRATVVLRYLEDLPDSAVADLMGCSVGTVKSQTAKALASLRGDLDALVVENDHA